MTADEEFTRDQEGDVRVSGHVLAQELQVVGEVPARDDSPLAGARAVRLVAQVPRVWVADVRPFATHVRHWNNLPHYCYTSQILPRITTTTYLHTKYWHTKPKIPFRLYKFPMDFLNGSYDFKRIDSLPHTDSIKLC